MENIHTRKLKQKIARRMVEFSALNNSRIYTDSGQPVMVPRSRSLTQPVEHQWTSQLIRTHSDPELNLVSLFCDVPKGFTQHADV